MKYQAVESTCGCWPIFIQMPIFSALYYAISRTEAIAHLRFNGLNLGQWQYISYITDYCSSPTLLQIKFQSNITYLENKYTMLKHAANYDAAMIRIYWGLRRHQDLCFTVTANLFTMTYKQLY